MATENRPRSDEGDGAAGPAAGATTQAGGDTAAEGHPGGHVAQPFIGPRPFLDREEDRKIFFGRDREAKEIASRVIAHAEFLLFAQSAAGKTSLVNARIRPMLAARGFDVLPTARVQGPEPEVPPERIDNIYVFQTLMCWQGKDADPKALAIRR